MHIGDSASSLAEEVEHSTFNGYKCAYVLLLFVFCCCFCLWFALVCFAFCFGLFLFCFRNLLSKDRLGCVSDHLEKKEMENKSGQNATHSRAWEQSMLNQHMVCTLARPRLLQY